MKIKDAWLRENIREIVTILLIAFCCTVEILILFKQVKTDTQTTTTLLNNTHSLLMVVASFFFISSKTSTDRAKAEIESKSSEQVKTETVTTERKVSPAPIIPVINSDMIIKLKGLGYDDTDIKAMTHDQANEIINGGRKK